MKKEPIKLPTISFNKLQRLCKNHIMILTEFGTRCICDIAEDPKREICNKVNCPILREAGETDESNDS